MLPSGSVTTWVPKEPPLAGLARLYCGLGPGAEALMTRFLGSMVSVDGTVRSSIASSVRRQAGRRPAVRAAAGRKMERNRKALRVVKVGPVRGVSWRGG